jgi:drug/metabolite transporter (DMT)-like permease
LDFFVVIARVFFSSFANVFQKKLAHQHFHPFFVVMASYFVLAVICLPILPLINFQEVHLSFWLNIFFAAALDMAGTLFLVMSLSKTDLSIFGPLNAYKVVFSMLFALAFLGEIPSGQGLLGVLIIIIASCFLLPRQSGQSTVNLVKLFQQKGVQYRFISILLFSIGTLPLKQAVNLSDPLATTVFWCLFGLPLAFLAYQLVVTSPIQMELKKTSRHIHSFLYLGFMIFLMQYMTMIVFSQFIIAYALALFQLNMVLQVILGYHVFKEQYFKQRLIASLIMVIGSLFIINA